MHREKSMAAEKDVKKIVFITPSSIGDVVFSMTSLDYLKQKFKNASFTVVSGPGASVLFSHDPRVKEALTYNKRVPFREKFALFNRLRKERFDVIIDLHDTVFRWFASARYKNPYSIRVPRAIRHLRLWHLYKTMAAFGDTRSPGKITITRDDIYLDKQSVESANVLLRKNNLSLDSEYILVAPGARSRTKRWHTQGFIDVCRELLKHHTVVLIGDENDLTLTQEINHHLEERAINITGKTTLLEVVAIIKKAKLVIGHDSAILHMTSYLDRPALAIFGPTDERRSGPYSSHCAVVRKSTICSPCLSDNCREGWVCMKNLSAQRVCDFAVALLEGRQPGSIVAYQRVLVTRTDRLGDVVLSTPVIKNLRARMPNAYIAMMVQESVVDAVRLNPYLDEVITLDKRGRHKGIFNSIRFVRELKKKRFDLALILHPTLRMHVLLFCAGITERIGYDRKGGFLNTRRLKHTKQSGAKHESEFALDFLKELGIDDYETTLFMPLYREAEEWADDFFKEKISASSKMVAVHAQASCPSKCWPSDYYRRLIDDIIKSYKATIVYVGSQVDTTINEERGIVNLTGKTTIAQLASVLKRSDLFISNDSGPVHMAVALGIPVISIFGRNQPGLSPKRWGPLGAGTKSVFLHKDVGCQVCLAHDCERDFSCLKAVAPSEVFTYVDTLLSTR